MSLNINIEGYGELYNLREVITELRSYYDNFDTHSMNDYCLVLEGKKEMLGGIIEYLEKIIE